MAAYMYHYLFPAHRPLVASAVVRELATLPDAQIDLCRRLERINGEAWPDKNIKLGDIARRWQALEHVAETEPSFSFGINPAGEELLWIQVHAELRVVNPYIVIFWMERRFDALTTDRQDFYRSLVRKAARNAQADNVICSTESRGYMRDADCFLTIDGVRVLDDVDQPEYMWIANGVALPCGIEESKCLPVGDGYREWRPMGHTHNP